MKTVPVLETDRLILKPISLEDAESYQENFNDYEVLKYLSFRVPWPYPDNGAEEFICNFVIPNQGVTRWSWGIRLKSNPQEIVGAVELFVPGIPENRGFWLGKKYWNQGYMTEAVKPVMDFAFHELNLPELTFANAKLNNRSRRVKEKTGATLVEIRQSKYVDPGIKECEYWRLKREDWNK